MDDQEPLPLRATPPPPGIAPTLADSNQASEPAPWGLWATIGFSVIIAAAFVGAGVAVGIVFVLVAAQRGHPVENLELGSSGLFISLATCVTTPVTVGLCWLFAWLRKGIKVTEYLGLRRSPAKVYVRSGATLVIFMVVADVTSMLLGRPVVPDVMLNAYRSAEVVPLLWLVVIVGAPLSEEIFFRGFIFCGIEKSRLGPVGAVLLTSAAWASVHLQYDWYEIGNILVLGLLLGVVRLRSGSVLPGMLMHAFNNLVATIQVALLAG